MRILALDLGTSTGWALKDGAQITAGTWRLASAKEVTAWGKVRLTRRKDPRVTRLCEHLAVVGPVDVLVFEDVEFVKYRKQAHLWAAFRSAAWLCGVATHFEAVPVQTLKKFATGRGGATKNAMAKFLQADRRALCDSEDSVDAMHLLLWAEKNLTRLATTNKV